MLQMGIVKSLLLQGTVVHGALGEHMRTAVLGSSQCHGPVLYMWMFVSNT